MANDYNNDSLGEGTQAKQSLSDEHSPKSGRKDSGNQNDDFGCTMSMDDNTASKIVKFANDKTQGVVDKIGDPFDESKVKSLPDV